MAEVGLRGGVKEKYRLFFRGSINADKNEVVSYDCDNGAGVRFHQLFEQIKRREGGNRTRHCDIGHDLVRNDHLASAPE
jgi:hypothetical protein